MRGKKNDFSISFYQKTGRGKETKRVLFLEFVHDTKKALQWVDDKKIEWTEAIIYNRRTRERIEKIDK